jgi:hypothetical protein
MIDHLDHGGDFRLKARQFLRLPFQSRNSVSLILPVLVLLLDR